MWHIIKDSAERQIFKKDKKLDSDTEKIKIKPEEKPPELTL